MAIIGPCTYDAQGHLVRPHDADIARAKTQLFLDTGEGLTLDAGQVHVHVVDAAGLTPQVARERVNAKLARFFETAEFTSGYRKIAMRKFQGKLPANGNFSITYEVVYAVESDARARTHSPESPHAGSQRGRSQTAAGW
jgi:hypothetical protein